MRPRHPHEAAGPVPRGGGIEAAWISKLMARLEPVIGREAAPGLTRFASNRGPHCTVARPCRRIRKAPLLSTCI